MKALAQRLRLRYLHRMKSHQETLEESCLAMIAQGRPGWDAAQSRCSWPAGCAAAQLVTPLERVEIEASFKQSAADEPACSILANAGHDPDFVARLQEVHDRAAYRACGDSIAWRRSWLSGLQLRAVGWGVDPAPVFEAARAAGWEIPA